MNSRVALLTPLVVLASGCFSTDRRPRLPPGPELARVPDADDRRRIGLAVEDLFGTPDEPLVPEGSGLDRAKLERGRPLVRDLCVACHGSIGEGEPATAPSPHARDFRRAVFKHTTTAPDAKPTRADLAATLRRGIPPRMPAFELLPDEQIEALVETIVWCAERGEVERRLVSSLVPGDSPSRSSKREAVTATGESWTKAESQVIAAPGGGPPLTPELAKWGKELFAAREAGCAACHGADARGGGPTANELRDAWGELDPPPDLTRGVFACGKEPGDLFRAIAAGLKGTPMPGYRETLGRDQIWDLVAYLRELNERH